MKTDTINLNLTIQFTTEISLSDISETAEQVLFALINHVNNFGLQPVSSDALTNMIAVAGYGETVDHVFYVRGLTNTK